jgi:hypothetical protein
VAATRLHGGMKSYKTVAHTRPASCVKCSQSSSSMCETHHHAHVPEFTAASIACGYKDCVLNSVLFLVPTWNTTYFSLEWVMPATVLCFESASASSCLLPVAPLNGKPADCCLSRLQLPIGVDTTSQQEDGRCQLEVIINYSGLTGTCGLRQFGKGVVTCQQTRRARAWVPCVDLHNKFNCWNLQFQVRPASVKHSSCCRHNRLPCSVNNAGSCDEQ